MGHPLIDEFCRAHTFKPEFLRRCQREFRDSVQPLIDDRDVVIDERDRLLTENADLRAQLEKLQSKAERRRTEAAQV